MEHHIPGWPDADGSGFSGAAGDRRLPVWIGCTGCLVDTGCQSEREETAWKKVNFGKKKQSYK